VLTVRGRVSTFHERQLTWITLCDLAGMEEFVDRVEVAEPVPTPHAEAQQPVRATLDAAQQKQTKVDP
jgi:hypothetical protein